MLRATHCWLSHGSPAITAPSDEEEDSAVEEVDNEYSKELEDSDIQQKGPSPTRVVSPAPTKVISPAPARLSCSGPTRLFSPSPARVSLADISNVSARRHEPEESHLQKKIEALERRLAEFEKGGHSTAHVVPHHQPYPAPVPLPPYPMSWAMSPPPYYGNILRSPLGFHRHFMAASPFETPRAMIPDELDDEIDFDGVFSNYGSLSPLRVRQETIEESWRKSCSQCNFGVLLVKSCFSERERATSNCTGDHRYGKKALSPKRLKAVKEAIASVQPPQPGQKEEEWWKPYKDAINSSCRSITRGRKTLSPYLFQ